MQKPIDYLDYSTTFQLEFVKHYSNKKPCIIRGCVDQWEAFNWDFPTLRNIGHKGEYKGNLHRVIIKDPNTNIWQECHPNHLPKIREKLQVNTLEYQPDEWLFSVSNPEMLDALKIPSNLTNPKWLEQIPLSLRPIYPRLLIGYQDTGSDLHIDVCNTPNWMALVKGVKHWFVVDPQEGKKIENYLGKFTKDTGEIKNKINHYYEFDLQSGEMVYLPSKWLHQVYNVEDTIAITYNLFNLFQAMDYCLDTLPSLSEFLPFPSSPASLSRE